MYRPLYWFGVGNTPNLNPSSRIAASPMYSNGGRTVTINAQGLQWSNGLPVTATDVLFWMNMLKADATSWGATHLGRASSR